MDDRCRSGNGGRKNKKILLSRSFHYTVGDHQYHNKLEAVLHNLKHKDPIMFAAPYEDTNFSLEPQDSLQTLITRRLQYLRDTHKTVKLYYSGGSDSHLLLENVIANNLHIDEIVCLKSGIPTADYEIENFAEPFLQKHRHSLRHTQITIKTPTLDDYRNFYRQGVTPEKIRSGAVGTHNYFRLHWPLDMYGQERDNDVIHIRGMEKPKIMKHNDDYFTYFLDGDMEPHANNHQFYSIDKEIQCKQSHMFLDTFKQLTVENESDIWNEERVWNESIGRYITGQSLPLKKVYVGCQDNHIVHKGLKLYYHNKKEHMALMWAQENCPDILESWYENLEELKHLTNYQWWNDGHPEMGTIGVFSKFYCLTRNDTKTVDELFPNGFENSMK